MQGPRLELDFPAKPPRKCEAPAGLVDALGGNPREILDGGDKFLVLYDSEREVAALAPDMQALARLDKGAEAVRVAVEMCKLRARLKEQMDENR